MSIKILVLWNMRPFCGRIATFRRNTLLPSSGLKYVSFRFSSEIGLGFACDAEGGYGKELGQWPVGTYGQDIEPIPFLDLHTHTQTLKIEAGIVSEKSISANITSQKTTTWPERPTDTDLVLEGWQDCDLSLSLCWVSTVPSLAPLVWATGGSPPHWCGTVGLPPSDRGDLPRYIAVLSLDCNRIS